MQANWIGRSEGAEVDFTLCDQDGEPIEGDEARSPSSPRVPIPSLASPSLSWLPSTLVCTSSSRARSTRRPSPRSSRIPSISPPSSVPRHPREARCLYRPLRGEPRERREGPRVGCRLCRCRLRHWRRHGRSLRRQRDFEFARKYDLPIVPIILDDDDRAAVEASGETMILPCRDRRLGLRPRRRGHARPVRQVHRHARR